MKEKKQPQTRANEVIIKTLDPNQMMGLYIKKNVCKKWTEDFLEEDTGKVYSLERSEILFRAGTYVDHKTQQKINFDIIEGSITEPIELSNQDRSGIYSKGYGLRKWTAKVYTSHDGKVKKYMLTARGIEHAVAIIEDYMETRTNGAFGIVQLVVADSAVFIEDEITHLTETDLDKMYAEGVINFNTYCDALDNTEKDNHPDEDNRTFWQMSFCIDWTTKKQSHTADGDVNTFIVHSVSADIATKAILRWLTMEDHQERKPEVRKADGEKVFTLHLQEAKQLPIHAIIPIEYTEANAPKKDEDGDA